MNFINMFQILECSIKIDAIVPSTTSAIIGLVQIAIPIVLIVLGMVDLGKAVMSNDEKEMKGAQTKLIKRIIYAVVIFFIVALVKMIFSTLGDAAGGQNNDIVGQKTNSENITSCIDCFVNNRNCNESTKKNGE